MESHPQTIMNIAKHASGYSAIKKNCEVGARVIEHAREAHQNGELIPALAAAGLTVGITTAVVAATHEAISETIGVDLPNTSEIAEATDLVDLLDNIF